MTAVLDIGPLRSLVAVADCGGFQRAATHLHLSQAAVSQHVRRLEAAVGRPLVERHGRGSRFTGDGEQLLGQARRILALHDETLRGFDVDTEETVTVGCTEHAAAQLLPSLLSTLEATAPGYHFRFRIDRGLKLREGLSTGRIDLALLLNADDPHAVPVGELDLTWYSGPTWTPPSAPTPVSVVAFDNPCALRNRALETLAAHGVPAVIGAEAMQLAGVHAAVMAGLGVALMATLGQTPEGLVVRDDLPRAEPLQLYVCARHGLPTEVSEVVAQALRPLLGRPAPLAVGA
ncbi:MAG TPA: LysR family transcriptional regulator [Nocardioides bacterium]|uniref:LysR family transcriptional regulator n=1 Tax=uncultured Nocardioides sp. TaxID=198441 RepID=UPI000EC80351|nr:LysR family transcriptional regulator [uncultured Nocardioides sp.]HCB06590.1 LysR family transcriptional regulator [Nocardioides sp.]